MNEAVINEDYLHAYVDGQLSDEDCARVVAYLDGNPEMAAKVADWAAQNEAILALFPAAEAPIELPVLAAANHGYAPLRSLVASVAILAVGVALGWGGHMMSNQGNSENTAVLAAGLVDQAIAAHVVFTSDATRPVEIGADREDLLIKWLSNRLGQKLAAPDLRTQGYELVGGRLLSSGIGPAAQFMYENAEGVRITVYASNSSDSRLAEFTFKRGEMSGDVSGVGSFYWQDESLQYAVVGDVTRQHLSVLATLIYQQLS